ncbi:MAG: adenylate/guanylate cyclase domain-containing protein [Mariprofundaceae bacterium]|nr:adenylate/guanylate cyclase domain-containing protein [Mariprofundaceae bacterium]
MMDNNNQHKPTILVVDDTPENIDVLRAVLKSQYKVKIAINGERALRQCRTKQKPDLVLLDVMMPGMDGFEVCRQLKADTATKSIPVIFVTAMNEVSDEVTGFEAGGVDYINKPITPALVLSRVKTHLKLQSAYRFIRDTFGRYLSDEIVNQLIDSPEGLNFGGEKRNLTIMMADLRGFTSISERLPAETVVKMINIFLSEMTELIQKNQGTIDEFIGDAILAIFGAPIQREDDALRAVRCAIEMQQAMQKVNKQYLALGYPAVEMGIGINTGDVIVGNIGSKKRSKYGVVGQVVNITSRIESYTVGQQILISHGTKDACRGLLQVNNTINVMLKGLPKSINLYDISGVTGEQALVLPTRRMDALTTLDAPITIKLMPLIEKSMMVTLDARIIGLGLPIIQIAATQPCTVHSNVKISIVDAQQNIFMDDIYAKVVKQLDSEKNEFLLHITSLPPIVETFFSTIRKKTCPPPLLLHLSDCHIYAEPEHLIKGINANDSLAAVIAHAKQHYPNPDAFILGGDLVQDQSESGYQRLATMLKGWKSPFMITPGNHCKVPLLYNVLPPALQAISSYHNSLCLASWQLITLNSHHAGNVSGLLADQELEHLETFLNTVGDDYALIALHHPPVLIDSYWMDQISLKNQDALWSVIDRFPQVRAIICGHIHQAFDTLRGNVRILGVPSTSVQFTPKKEAFTLDDRSPGYRWLKLLPDGTLDTGIERIEGFIPPDLNNNIPY